MRSYKLFLFLFALLTLFSACTQEKTQIEQPNIVWITSEDNSKHYMKLFDEHGVEAPNVEKLAAHGIKFNHAFSNAPVCSAARSTLISGCYGPRIGAHYHRKIQMAPMPEGLEMYPAYLKQAGYYTTNNYKEDYNIFKSDTVWDESKKGASWRNRAEGQPFFHVHNILTTHESRLHFSKEEMETVENKNAYGYVFPVHPETETFKYTNARYRDKIQQMDSEVGDVLAELEKDSLMENTFIFYYGDHGGVLPGSKGYLFETGLHVPLVVYIPEKYRHLVDYKPGSEANGFVSFADFGPTLLSLAGIEIPELVDGKPFLGKNISAADVETRNETFGYADRFDEKYDMVRTYRKGKYKYVRNFQPYNFDGLMNNYRYKQLAFKEWSDLNEEDKLNEVQAMFFNTKPAEALFDVETDPFETKNLAGSEEYAEVLKEMRNGLTDWMKGMPDLSMYPEHYLIANAFDNPVAFGQKHKADISNYIDIANLSLGTFDNAKAKIKEGLSSEDPWVRYWTLTACSAFENNAKEFAADIKNIAKTDAELINKVRAAEFLGLTKEQKPAETMQAALYATNNGTEALEILNSIVMMKDCELKYNFDIKLSEIQETVKNDPLVKQRLYYLGVMEAPKKKKKK